MLFIKVTRSSKDQVDRTTDATIRADHILQMSGSTREGVTTWLLLDKIGWFPVVDTQEELLAKIKEAKADG